jgi:ABC-2 type transport system permease protein
MLAPLVIIILAAIGGAMVPRMFMPSFMKQIGYFSPVAWSIDGFHNVFWRHQGVGGMITEFSVLLGFSIVFLTIGIVLVRTRLKSW